MAKIYCRLFSVLMLCLPGFSIYAQTAKHIVVIDPAHGGEDTGVLSIDKVAEKDLTLAIAFALQKELAKENNIEVVLTRNSDKTLYGWMNRKKYS
ncbi:MAG: N-acetylmuramoyl-L-alanine amidase [Candidatus Moduliflexus flocculans]|nr:N-acetylmuramoyl-L-alanine amidase [Candidatus Moduliflexus flocculans]